MRASRFLRSERNAAKRYDDGHLLRPWPWWDIVVVDRYVIISLFLDRLKIGEINRDTPLFRARR